MHRMHGHVPRGPPLNNGPQAPRSVPYLNYQRNQHYPLHGTQKSHHFPTPSLPPPPTAYWRPMNSQPQQPSSMQCPLFNRNSGLITSFPAETLTQSLAPHHIQSTGETNSLTLQQKRKEKIREKKMRKKRKIKEAKAEGTYCPTIQRKAKDKERRRRQRKQKEAKTEKNVCYEDSNRNGVRVNRQIHEVSPLSELLVAEGDVKLGIDINTGRMPMQIRDISSKRISVEPSQNICNGVSECSDMPVDSMRLNISQIASSTLAAQSETDAMACRADGLANAQICAYDLNLPPSKAEDAMLKGSLHFAPITPEKAPGAERKIASQMPNICTYERQGLERNVPEVDRDAAKRLGPKIGRRDKELQEPLMGSPSSAVSTLVENHDPQKGGPQIMSLNKTPQEETRRKNYRPKVVKEGKPKRTLRSTASKPADGGKTTVERKYVRRKGVEKPPASPREGAVDSSIDLKVRQLPRKSCRKALNFDIKDHPRKKRTKKRLSLVTSAYGGALQLHGPLIMHNNQSTFNRLSGAQTELLWRQMTSVNAIVKQSEHLDINRENDLIQNALAAYEMTNHEHSALALCKRDRTTVPFNNSFGPMKKERPRPKVDLDEETSRVWKLLSENINSEGIDGTDEEKARWWEEERRVFQGRANLFIALMHLVQGDRRFSPWKGSVVDSVVGVFLTQNVSDHLSSSAFMSLASRFPQKPIPEMCSDEGTAIIINGPDLHILEMEYPLSEKTPNETVCGQSLITNNEYENNETKEVVSSNNSVGSKACSISLADEPKCQMSISSASVSEKLSAFTVDISTAAITQIDEGHIKGDGKAEISSQSSVDSPPAQAAERAGSSSNVLMNTFSKTDSLDGLQSFMQLLDMAGSNVPLDVSVREIEDNVINKSSEMEDGEETLQTDTSCARSTSTVTCCLGLPEVECPKRFLRETNFSESSKNENEQIIKDAITFSITDSKMTQICEESREHSIKNNQPRNSCLGGENSEDGPAVDRGIVPEAACQGETSKIQTDVYVSELSGEKESTATRDISKGADRESTDAHPSKHGLSLTDDSNKMNITNSKGKSRGAGKKKKEDFDWDSLRRQAESNGRKRVRTPNTMDSADWEAVRCADVNEIADAIKERGMNNVLAGRIKDFLNQLAREHEMVNLEWLREVPPDKAKEYLLSIRGLGLKSVECVRLLTLHHLAFPVDTNVGRIAVRLGWVALQPLPESLQLHLLELYPVLESIQQYLWPRLCKLDQRTLYELHYQMITFGKVFCTKRKPNCNACPMRGECRHFASAFASARLALPGPEEMSIVNAMGRNIAGQNIGETLPLSLPQAKENLEEQQEEARARARNCLPIIEEPATPEPDCTRIAENDMEDMFSDDFNEIPTIKLNMEEFTQNLQKYMQHNTDLQEDDMSKALVALTPEAASIPVPKLRNVSRLRTEHLVYEIPEGHPLMNGLDKLEADDPSKYLLAIWTPGETASSVQPPEHRCNSQEFGTLCNEITCVSCNSIREANSQTVRGTFLIPCRTAMRGSFPLNGTYFQVNELFADHETSINPIDVPRSLLWKLQRRTVYFGTSIPTIFKGLSAEDIRHCFWRGFVCVRGFDRKTRAPRPLMARLHFPACKLPKTKGKKGDGQ